MVDRPLVVDLDGTLITTDLLHETASAYLSRHPARAFDLVRWGFRGKQALKSELHSRVPVDPATLPYNQSLLSWLTSEREAGRSLHLASASDERAVSAIAEYLGIFDGWIGSRPGVNLRSQAKAEALVAQFGPAGFDYVGNHAHDLAVWAHSTTAHVVGREDGRLAQRAAGLAEVGRGFPPAGGGLRALVKALRPHQWVKNVLVVLPLFLSGLAGDREAILATILALIAFCLAASGVYVLNDLADVEHDRRHPTKRRRPFAAGQISLLHGWLVWPVLSLAAFGIAWTVSVAFTLVLAGYVALTLAYTFALKRKPVMDVMTLAGLYTARIIAGAAAIGVVPSMWLLAFSGFLFLSLGLVKRVSELTRVRRSASAKGKAAGRGYVASDLELLSSYGVATSVAAAVILTLFVADPATASRYGTPEILWAVVPILLAWLMRVWLLAHRGAMNEDPIVFAIKDRVSLIAGLLMAIAFVAAHFLTIG